MTKDEAEYVLQDFLEMRYGRNPDENEHILTYVMERVNGDAEVRLAGVQGFVLNDLLVVVTPHEETPEFRGCLVLSAVTREKVFLENFCCLNRQA